MSYSLYLHATNLADFEVAIASRTKSPPPPEGRPITEDEAEQLHSALEEQAHLYATLTHSSGSYEWFWEEFLRDVVDVHLTDDDPTVCSKRLSERSISGLFGEEFPLFGYLTIAEIGAMLANRPETEPDIEDPEIEELWVELIDALETAARFGLDIIGTYT
jgi:hypothetical protein